MPAAAPDAIANATALVLFSGGQDSTTCLAWALARFGRVETLGFDYGQRHAVELACRARIRARLTADFPRWAPRLGDDHTLALPSLGAISETALTRAVDITTHANGLPSTFVPGRNLLFLTYAGALAWRRGATRLVTGVCETDYSGYPDCRDDTVKSLQATLNLGMETRMVIHTPLMWRTKAQTWWLAERLGGAALVDIVLADTHTCYLGDRTHRHPWGYGCGACPACRLRAAGWEEYQAQQAAPDADPARLAGITE